MENRKPVVSVIITCYNKAKWIERCVNSAISQECNFPIEILIIDDCSTDNSLEILQKIEKSNNNVKLLQNETNLGITKTWIKICKKAKGKYIARIDGDDYWCDQDKLQKQVDALKNHPEYKWCSTDISMFSSVNNTWIHKSLYKDEPNLKIDDFEKMIALKGCTQPSTWLCEAKLMNDINSKIDTNAVDDTFNIQLELFAQAQKLYIDQVTTVYNDTPSSDSEFSIKRWEGLLKTQLEYVDKFPNRDYKKAFIYLLKESNKNEIEMHKQLIKNVELNKTNNELNQKICGLNNEVHMLKNSLSMRVTAPLRKVSSLIKKK